MNIGPMLNLYPDSLGGTLDDVVDFLKTEEAEGAFSSCYILPSLYHTDLDRGFSVIDYSLNKMYASGETLEAIKKLGIELKLDFILNHASVLSKQFQDIIAKGEESEYKDFFINWNEFWKDCGEMTEQGYILPEEKYLKKMFFRKPGLPILMVRFPDGREIPYWKEILRVVVAVAVTDATRVKSIKYYDPNVNTATDAVIGTRTVDGKDYALTDILNQMAEAIKKIAGDTNFTNNPSRTLKTITDTVNGLSSVYYRKTDTVAEAAHAARADVATRATTADNATNVATCVKKAGDTMTGTLKVPGLSNDSIDLDYLANNKAGYSGFTFGELNNYRIWGTEYWGIGAMFPWYTSQDRILGTQLYFANSNAAFIRFDTNAKGMNEWQRLATFEKDNSLTFPNGAKLKVE